MGVGKVGHGQRVGLPAGGQGVGVVGGVGGEAATQRGDQGALEVRSPALGRRAQLAAGARERRGAVGGIEGLPGLVVIGADGIRDAPVRDRQLGSAASARSKQSMASSWLNANAHTSPRSNHNCACSEGVATARW